MSLSSDNLFEGIHHLLFCHGVVVAHGLFLLTLRLVGGGCDVERGRCFFGANVVTFCAFACF